MEMTDISIWVTVFIFAATIIAVVSGVVDSSVAAVVGVIAKISFGTMTEGEAFNAVDWNVMAILVSIWIIAGYLGKTGIPEWLSIKALEVSGGHGGLLVMILASVINIIVANLAEATILTVVGPLVLYVVGVSVMMPAITVLALDCLPTHRGTAASMQGFLQMMTNAGVASLAVPFLNDSWLNFVYGQLVFLLFAVGLWFRLGRVRN